MKLIITNTDDQICQKDFSFPFILQKLQSNVYIFAPSVTLRLCFHVLRVVALRPTVLAKTFQLIISQTAAELLALNLLKLLDFGRSLTRLLIVSGLYMTHSSIHTRSTQVWLYSLQSLSVFKNIRQCQTLSFLPGGCRFQIICLKINLQRFKTCCRGWIHSQHHICFYWCQRSCTTAVSLQYCRVVKPAVFLRGRQQSVFCLSDIWVYWRWNE